MVAVSLVKLPYCNRCANLRYIVSRGGKPRACPRCSCRTCQRLKHLRPAAGGCTCHQTPAPRVAGDLLAALEVLPPPQRHKLIAHRWIPDVLRKRG